MRKLLVVAALLVAASSVVAPRATAQSTYFTRHSKWYGGVGVGAGMFTLTCDANCPGDNTSSNVVVLHLGRHFSPAFRAEVGVQHQPGTEGDRAHLSALSAGVAYYVIPNLYVRAAVGSLNVAVEDTTGVTEGSSGLGGTVGAGYDVFLGSTFALTPYVNYVKGSFSTLDRSAAANNGATVTTKGSVTGLNFGVALTWRRKGRNTGY